MSRGAGQGETMRCRTVRPIHVFASTSRTTWMPARNPHSTCCCAHDDSSVVLLCARPLPVLHLCGPTCTFRALCAPDVFGAAPRVVGHTPRRRSGGSCGGQRRPSPPRTRRRPNSQTGEPSRAPPPSEAPNSSSSWMVVNQAMTWAGISKSSMQLRPGSQQRRDRRQAGSAHQRWSCSRSGTPASILSAAATCGSSSQPSPRVS